VLSKRFNRATPVEGTYPLIQQLTQLVFNVGVYIYSFHRRWSCSIFVTTKINSESRLMDKKGSCSRDSLCFVSHKTEKFEPIK